jgi:hypothetical protein
LILLAIQQLLRGDAPSESNLLLSALLLEAGMEYSPHNAYLKIEAMLVYSQLNAVARSWELYHDLFIKHIQNESCTYLILPLLRRGGFYKEVIQVCQEILRLQTAAAREVVEFTGRALENGVLSKVDEFVTFHRERMNKSLTTLEAKGLVLNCAPMYQFDDKQPALGAVHGIVGDSEDMNRVMKIVSEAHNPFAAFSLLKMNGSVEDYVDQFSENRDFSILTHEILLHRTFDSKESIVSASLRRGLQHNLLIRAALCVDGTKGLKKGKPVKSSEELQRRCLSLYTVSERVHTSADQFNDTTPIMLAMSKLCQVLIVVGGGFHLESKTFDGPLNERESLSTQLLKAATLSLQQFRANESISTLAQVSLVLSDSIVPLFVLTRMCGKSLDIIGCGRKKRHSKECAGAMAQVALALLDIVNDLTLVITRYVPGRSSMIQLSKSLF